MAEQTRKFFRTALEDIGPKIKKGTHVLIDPAFEPRPGCYVLVRDRLEIWDAQKDHSGVAIQGSTRYDDGLAVHGVEVRHD